MSIEKQDKIIKKKEVAEMTKEQWLSEEMAEKIVEEKLLDIFSGPEKNRPRGKDTSIPSTGRLSPFVVHGTNFENFESILKFGFDKEKRIEKDMIAGDFPEDEQRIYFTPICKNGLKLSKYEADVWKEYFPVNFYIDFSPLEEENREDFLKKYREESEQHKIKYGSRHGSRMLGEVGDSYNGFIPIELIKAIKLKTGEYVGVNKHKNSNLIFQNFFNYFGGDLGVGAAAGFAHKTAH